VADPPRARSSMVVTLAQIAAIIGVTERRIQQLAEEGMPKAGREGYPMVACVQWVIAYWQKRATTSPLGEARRRKIEADAGNAELDLKIKQGSLAEIGAIGAAHGQACSRLRTRLLAIPSKVAPKFRRFKTAAEAQAEIRREIVEALEELSSAPSPQS
jgi:phage terminase Nu1 subunit (DNA packaging protein)